MKKIYVSVATLLLPAALVLQLGGCRDPGPDSLSQKTQDASDATTGDLKRHLPSGIDDPSFSFHVDVDRDTGARRQGRKVREIGLELLGPTPAEAEAAFSAQVIANKGSLKTRESRGKALRVVYGLSDGTSMLAWFRASAPKGEDYIMHRHDATGTLYLAWPYVEKAKK